MMEPTEKQKKQFRNALDEIHPLSNDCWGEIEHFFYVSELSQKEYFSKEGQLIRELGFILDGILRIYYLNSKGEEWNKHFLQKNDFVASSVSPQKKSITNIQALTKTTILCIPYFELEKIAIQYKELTLFIKKLAFSYLEQKQVREISLLSEDATSNYLNFVKNYPDFENKIQHYHIASYLGITPTQLSRLRKKLNTHQHL